MGVSGVSNPPQPPVSELTGEGPPTTMPPSQQEVHATEPAAPDAGTGRAPSSEPSLSDAIIRSRFTPIAV